MQFVVNKCTSRKFKKKKIFVAFGSLGMQFLHL